MTSTEIEGQGRLFDTPKPRRTRKQRKERSDPEWVRRAFEQFMELYPRNNGEGPALRAFRARLSKGDTVEDILHRVHHYLAALDLYENIWLGDGRPQVMLPATFLNSKWDYFENPWDEDDVQFWPPPRPDFKWHELEFARTVIRGEEQLRLIEENAERRERERQQEMAEFDRRMAYIATLPSPNRSFSETKSSSGPGPTRCPTCLTKPSRSTGRSTTRSGSSSTGTAQNRATAMPTDSAVVAKLKQIAPLVSRRTPTEGNVIACAKLHVREFTDMSDDEWSKAAGAWAQTARQNDALTRLPTTRDIRQQLRPEAAATSDLVRGASPLPARSSWSSGGR